jgi:hypothetical protein
MTHTPGPWRVESGHEHTGRTVAELVDGRPGLREWRIVHDGPEDGDAEADARLIAAAPDLLSALTEYQRCNPLHHDGEARLFDLGDEVIAKGGCLSSESLGPRPVSRDEHQAVDVVSDDEVAS